MASISTSLLSKAQAKPGDKIPTETVKETSPAESFALNLKGKNVIVAVPGAFTPSCSSQVPGYIEKYDAIKAKGVNDIYVVAVNDTFVMKAWKEKLAPNGTGVRFISDDQGKFAGTLGLLMDATGALGAPRAKRFVIIADDDKISSLFVEENSSEVTVTASDKVLSLL
ncbi:hypothetical protein EW146_g4531 [Bondarzewia mesenterica]|uniref:Thioredoxin domain-containing protein n=1 Tax=Bondarzewia mesenterica TaxID=1095465 RepID=A0A4S4LWF2_9AGAM|nr:hypothetical protein EW146_g4531 [Bondarzewia mesenterica]